jgi:hypothetical protein
VEKLREMYSKGELKRALPPSEIIRNEFKNEPLNVTSLARKCLLPENEVNIWVEHLKRKIVTREIAVQKAQETKRKKKTAVTK